VGTKGDDLESFYEKEPTCQRKLDVAVCRVAPICLQVIPIGEKPTARAVAVGAKLVHEADGSVSYTW
jgi:hypothetical protein